MITLGSLTGFGRATVRDGCTGKQAFASYAEAEVELGKIIRAGFDRPEQGTLAPYHCAHCQRVHLGHFRGKP